MKKFKLSSIVLGIAATVSSSYMHGMHQDSSLATMISGAGSGASKLITAAFHGLSNMTVGYANPFIQEVETGNVSLDSTTRNHRYEHAIDELLAKKESEGLFQLIKTVQKHNNSFKDLRIEMSAQHQEKIKTPLEEFYAERNKRLISITKKQIEELVKRWALEYELEALDVAEQVTDMELISKTIGLVYGNKPNDAALRTELETIFEIQNHYTFIAAIQAVEQQKKNAAAQQLLPQAQSNHNKTNSPTALQGPNNNLTSSISASSEDVPNSNLSTNTTSAHSSSSAAPIATADHPSSQSAAGDAQHADSRKNSTNSATSPIATPIATSELAVTIVTSSTPPASLSNAETLPSSANNKKKKKKKGSNNNLQQLGSSSHLKNNDDDDDGDDE